MKYKHVRKKKEQLQDKHTPIMELLKDFVTQMSSVLDEIKEQNADHITLSHDNDLRMKLHKNMYDAVKRYNKNCEVVDTPFQYSPVTHKKQFQY